ncbi:16S rRNA (cytidine(1402)-2'-O)-methyltransferase [Albidovulum sp.]
MSAEKTPLEPGLHFVATPIGAARDITLRALDILAAAEVLAAEDTRTLRHLMEIHGVPLGGRPLVAYHEHNGPRMRPLILAHLAAGRTVAYASEAGTPLVADPGYQLARAAIAAGHRIHAAPGPSALLAALTVSGLPTDRFLFAGFAPSGRGQRRRWLAELADLPATIVLYESPRRIQEMLEDLESCFGQERRAALCRELTKRFEEVTRGTVAELRAALAGRTIRGEIVLVIDRAGDRQVAPADVDDAIREALACHSMKDAVSLVAQQLGLPRRQVYQRALKLAGDG